jgi:hypothetical protein
MDYKKTAVTKLSDGTEEWETKYKYASKACLFYTSVACAVDPSVNPVQNRETQHVNIVLQCMYRFFEEPNMKGNHASIEW